MFKLTIANRQEFQLQRRLQQDSIQLGGKIIYINPFLYWRRFDNNTDRWLREPGQLGEDQIKINRTRFYPELDWNLLDEEDVLLKDASVEMFLKSLELIGTFHPELNAGQLLEVERKMAVTKKRAFERWVEKSFQRKNRQESREKNRFQREHLWRSFKEWCALEMTHKALGPMVACVVVSGFGGWYMGVSSVTCPPFLVPSSQNVIR